MKSPYPTLLLMLSLVVGPAVATGETPAEIDALLEDMAFERALLAIESLEREAPLAPTTLYLKSRYLFMRGAYLAALEDIEQAVTQAAAPDPLHLMHRALVQAVVDELEGYQEHTTSGGHFVISYAPGPDEVLLEMADETLEAAYQAIGADFGYWPEEPVRVEIYPRTGSLANVSTLTAEAIQTSGTIALCKYNRLMITSPRTLLRGYAWRDTLTHEYVHFVIQRLTGMRVPIWLHEGLAAFEEHRWRGDIVQGLSPSRQELLASRIEADTLITFEQMHPSMALLPSQEDTATAFAEVFTVVEFLYDRHGASALRDLVWAIREGAEIEEAFEVVTDTPFQVFLSDWERNLAEREWERLPTDFRNNMEFMPEQADDATPDELAGMAEGEARNYMHLGQLLRARTRIEASIVEYRKAEALIGPENPLLQNWLARALLDLNRPAEAIEGLGHAVEYYPDFYLTHLHLGEALLRRGAPEQALVHLREAAGINPFDPEVHRQLSTAYGALDRRQDAARAQRHLTLVD